MAIRIGDVGRAVTAMTPSGYVEVHGRRLGARSEFGAIEVGSDVVILRGDPTGVVVRKWVAGESVTVPNSGEDVTAAAAQRKAAQVAEVDRRDAEGLRMQRHLRFRAGVMAAGSLGGLVGLTSACVGWSLRLRDQLTPVEFVTLVGGSTGVGLAAGIALFFATGFLGKVIGAMRGAPEFAPSFVAIFVALVGAASGFWWKYDSDHAGIIALGVVLGAVAGTAVGYVLRGCVGVVSGFVGGK